MSRSRFRDLTPFQRVMMAAIIHHAGVITLEPGAGKALKPQQDEPRCPHCDQACVVEERHGTLVSACCGITLLEEP